MTVTPPPRPENLDFLDTIIPYDRANILTYARVLDVVEERAIIDGRDWREASIIILGCDPDRDEPAARRCWDAHVARARWIIGEGLPLFLAGDGRRRGR
ncbi:MULTISPECIES: DUF2285 domain-containing protein [Sphingopyxis]|uniref:DUF2285 domain-containing protein n=1 Tax=Sphingopyxis panaciterrulae TaxID=462372 RepID=A0A7W9B8Z4_9SPHN|nr:MULTISPECIES: DUF2285 domain-containing protein [Sphingopyxis]MBB5708458.1 hypothetical protein [Sphingopyxis panaciterrulae]HEX2813637.1 DUF2285 domain-containing protein [Sphingopyxis sp.]